MKPKKNNSVKFAVLVGLISIASFMAGCSDDNPVEASGSSNSQVAGVVYGDGTLPKSLNKISSAAGVEGATVVLAEVQANGSLKTVSSQNVQTDAQGKFVVETSLSGTKNLVVVATKGSSEWKAVLAGEVKSNTKIFAPPLSTETTAQAELYSKIVASGKANLVTAADLLLFTNSEVAAQIKGNTSTQEQLIVSIESAANAAVTAHGNSYFGITSSQIQAIASARAQAAAALDADLYNAVNSGTTTESEYRKYQQALINAYINAGIKGETCAKLLTIMAKMFVKSSANLSSTISLAAAKSFYSFLSLAIRSSVESKFQEAGASSAQTSVVANAGATLTASIKSAVSINQIIDAFVQYKNSVKAQLKLVLSAQAAAIDTIDTELNSALGAKVVLNSALSASVTSDLAVSAYVTFFNSVKTLVQTSLAGSADVQKNAAAEIMMLINMN